MKRIYETSFCAGHFIAGHPKCGVPHGHNYGLRVEVDFDKDIWLDFGDLKKVVESILERDYDHKILGIVGYLNTDLIGGTNPPMYEINYRAVGMTAEILIQKLQSDIVRELSYKFGVKNFEVTVELWETSKFGVRYP